MSGVAGSSSSGQGHSSRGGNVLQQVEAAAFLSHSSAQRDFVHLLGSKLNARGLQYFSSAEPDDGEDREMLQHIRMRAAKVVVLVLSQEYFHSKWCVRELTEALAVPLISPTKVLLPIHYGWGNLRDLERWTQQQEPVFNEMIAQWSGQSLQQLCRSVYQIQGLAAGAGISSEQVAEQVAEHVAAVIKLHLPPVLPGQKAVSANLPANTAEGQLSLQSGTAASSASLGHTDGAAAVGSSGLEVDVGPAPPEIGAATEAPSVNRDMKGPTVPVALSLLIAGTDDRPAAKDSLGMEPVARGTAQFLLDPKTAATTLAVYARWGSGKSTFMKFVEAEMLLEAAWRQLEVIKKQQHPPELLERLYKRYTRLLDRHAAEGLSADDWTQLKALASPQLLTVWFNSWQYLTEEQVWAGLVVEVTQRLEEKLGHKQRRVMRGWWIISPWDFLRLLLVPMRLLAAFAYNWKTRRPDVILRCFLPVLLVLAVVGVCMGVGIWQLQQKASNATAPAAVTNSSKPTNTTTGAYQDTHVHKSAVAAIAAAGLIVSLLAAIVGAVTNCKQVSDTLIAARSHVHFADHKAKIGYQHAVIKDLCLLRKLLCKSLKPFRSEQAGCLQRLRACGSVATWCALRALAEFMAFMLLCCCGCCMWVHNRKALQDAILPMVQSDTESSAQRLTSIDDDEQPRIGVFIDDLDRCKPTKIIEVLEAINLVLAGSGFAVVVGMDNVFIRSAIQSAYKDVEIMQQEANATEFLDKIIQVELTLPTPAEKELLVYLQAQGVTGVVVERGGSLQGVAGAVVEPGGPLEADLESLASYTAAAALDWQRPARPSIPQEPPLSLFGVLDSDVWADAERRDIFLRTAATSADTAAKSAESAKMVVDAILPLLTRYRRLSIQAMALKQSAESVQKEAAFAAKVLSAAWKERRSEEDFIVLFSVLRTFNHTTVQSRRIVEESERFGQRAKILADHQCLASTAGEAPSYSEGESKLLRAWHDAGLLLNATPRELKRLLNRYLLAKYIMTARAEHNKGWFDCNEEPVLMTWVLLSWKFPLAMRELTKMLPPSSIAEECKLVDLLEKYYQQRQDPGKAAMTIETQTEAGPEPGAGAGGEAGAEARAEAGAEAGGEAEVGGEAGAEAGGEAGARGEAEEGAEAEIRAGAGADPGQGASTAQPQSQQEQLHQKNMHATAAVARQDLVDLEAAQVAVRTATEPAAKKKAEADLAEATKKAQLAGLWELCCSTTCAKGKQQIPQDLQAKLNISSSAMHK